MTSDAVSSPVSASGLRVLRPSRAAYGRALQANLFIAIPLLIVSLIRLALNPWLLPVLIVALALTVGGVLLYFRNTRIEFGDGSYTVVGTFGTRRSFTASQARVLVTVTSLFSSGRVSPQLVVIGESGAKILRLRGQLWDVEQFAELANDLIAHGVSNDAIREQITPQGLRMRYPKAISWFESHPYALALILSLGIVVIIVVGVVVSVAATYS